MIDLATETVMSLADAAKHLPKRRQGKKPHASTLLRWSRTGVRGVRLEVLRVGNTICTSLEALQRFCERCSVDDGTAPSTRTTSRRKRDHENATSELMEAGF